MSLSKKEIDHLEEVLKGDLDGYYNEVGVKDQDFQKWKSLSNSILKRIGKPEWEGPD